MSRLVLTKRYKLIAYAAGPVILLLLGTMVFKGRTLTPDEEIARLESGRILQQEDIQKLFGRRFVDLGVMAASEEVRRTITALEEAYDTDGRKICGPMWTEMADRYAGWVDTHVMKYGYTDLFLISSNGDVVFTASRGNGLGKNLQDEPGGIGKVYAKSKEKQTLGLFKLKKGPLAQPVVIVMETVRRDGKEIGTVGLQLALQLKTGEPDEDEGGVEMDGMGQMVSKAGNKEMMPLADLKTQTSGIWR
ncbi:MAG: hypothetical protein HQL56_16500 [Magnetococcales bacterium]|nr:hypothetical protein [Magnetococcales bacterium]